MSFGRFIKKAVIPGYNVYDTVNKIGKHGLIDGVKEKVSEDFLDIPGINQVYNAGKYQGKKEGYAEASSHL